MSSGIPGARARSLPLARGWSSGYGAGDRGRSVSSGLIVGLPSVAAGIGGVGSWVRSMRAVC
jgi:hypothetical protein